MENEVLSQLAVKGKSVCEMCGSIVREALPKGKK